jgi:regulatory protein
MGTSRQRDAAKTQADSDPESLARSVVLRKLAAAPQTRAQLDEAMAAKGAPGPVRERVLARFSDVGLIDDAAFARAWVDSRHSGRGLGKKALTHELRRRGVDDVTANEAASSVTPEHEEDMARRLVARKLRTMTRADPAAKTRRLAGMLARKGYPPGLSYRVVREAMAEEGVEEGDLPPEPV